VLQQRTAGRRHLKEFSGKPKVNKEEEEEKKCLQGHQIYTYIYNTLLKTA
jgi:hypothetical protein